MSDRHVKDEKRTGSTQDTLPRAIPIGPHTLTRPLVSIEYVKAHLSLLGGFASLRKRVEECLPEDLPELVRGLDNTPELPRRWTWFVCLAVQRFHRWAENVVANKDIDFWVETEIPPLDVLMIWHAYMSNPAWYAEDCLRIPVLQTLRALNNTLIPAVIAMGKPSQYRTSKERERTWLEQTGTPFDSIKLLKTSQSHCIICPKCEKSNVAPYLTANGTGYAQQGFKLTCPLCSLTIDKPALAMVKLAQDLVKDHNGPSAKLDTCLPGTLRGPTNQMHTKRAIQIKERIVQSDNKLREPTGASREDWKRKINEDFGYSINNVHGFLRSIAGPDNIGILRGMLDRILSAYVDDSPFSIDLVGAVIRQGSFISKMHAFEWTSPGYFDNATDEIVLSHAITRYHAFLDLMSRSTSSSFVPTLDIDLAWHTHQLMAGRYKDDCMEFIGRFIDHDDKVEENRLADAFDVTCKIWHQRFNVPYSYCGCPLPGDSIGDRLQRLTHKFLASKEQLSRLRPPTHPDIPRGTHASEHNAIQAHLSGSLSGARAAELRHRRDEREHKVHERGEHDAQRVRRDERDSEQCKRGEAHYTAFLAPVPLVQPGMASAGCIPVDQTRCATAPGGSCVGGGGCGSSALCTGGAWGGGATCAGPVGGWGAGCLGRGAGCSIGGG